jgi:hypothetical protein
MRLNSMRGMSAAIALSVALVWGSIASASVVVDGNLSDWGITISSTDNATTWSNGLTGATATASGVDTTPFTFDFDLEQQDDTAPVTGQLGPLQGGQDYDAEFLGIGLDGLDVVIAIVTGQRPDNTLANFSPGDIWISTSDGVFGIEVGGGDVVIDGGAALFGGSAGSFYNIDSGSGHTTSEEAGEYNAGDLVYLPEWENGIPASGSFPNVQMKKVSSLPGETLKFAGTALSYVYTRNSGSNGQHAIIELKIPLSAFLVGMGENTINSVQWAPSCGNDVVGILKVSTNVSTDVPEPTSLALLVMGGLSFLGVRRFRKQG